jgi:hypothetical protein
MIGVRHSATKEEAMMNEDRTALDELLNDPMVRMVMARDRVRPEELRRLIERGSALETRLPPHVVQCPQQACA